MKKTSMILCGMMLLASSAMAQVKVIAHRGYWNSPGAAQNSIAAMQNAKKADVWGSEFDVHITTDGIVVVNHDDDIHGIIIEEAKYADIKNLKLANGEPIATLKSYLEAGKKLAPMQLILEIKAHQTPEREDRCVKACLDLVKATGMEKQVDYISFSMHACEELVKLTHKPGFTIWAATWLPKSSSRKALPASTTMVVPSSKIRTGLKRVTTWA